MKRVKDDEGNEFEVYIGTESTEPSFPWGERSPTGGFKVGDQVGLIYSDHEEYIFDNPTGIVTGIDEDEDGEQALITVEVEASITADRVYLMARPITH